VKPPACGLVTLIPLAAFGLTSSAPAQQGAAALAPADPPAAEGAMAPRVFAHAGGVLLSWLEPVQTAPGSNGENDAESLRLRFARYAPGRGWSEARTIVQGVPFFANWADVPSVIIADDGALLAAWLEKTADATYAYDVRLARSIDGGATWTHLGAPHNDGTPTEHGFVSLVPEPPAARAFWLDGRAMAVVAGEDDDEGGHGPGDMTLRTAVITDRVVQGTMLDDRVCECCNTDAVLTDAGPIIFYRDRGHDEVRDISFVRYDGMEWSLPQPVHIDGWEIAGCPVNGPAADARGSAVVVVWYTAAASRPLIRAAFSRDAGATFEPPIILDDGQPLGRVDVALDPDGSAIACWLDGGAGFGTLVARRFGPDGRAGPKVSVAASSSRRSGGFARLARVADDLLLVWMEDRPTLRIRAAIVDPGEFPTGTDENPPVRD